LTERPEPLYGRSMICKPATFRAIRRRRNRDSEGRRRVRD